MRASTSILAVIVVLMGSTSVASAEQLLHSHSEDWGTLRTVNLLGYVTPIFETYNKDTDELFQLNEFVGDPRLDASTTSGTTLEVDLGTAAFGTEWEQILTNGNAFDEIAVGFQGWSPDDVPGTGWLLGNIEGNWVNPNGFGDLVGHFVDRVELTLDTWLFGHNPDFVPGDPINWWQTEFGATLTMDFYGTPVPEPGTFAMLTAAVPVLASRRRAGR